MERERTNHYIRWFAALIILAVSAQLASADWVNFTGNTNGTGWTNGDRARDDNTSTYASHSPVLGWGGWLSFSLDAPIWSDRFRVMSDFGYGEVDSVQIDVSEDDVVWTTIFAGVVPDATWDTQLFTAQNVRYARFRYHRLTTSYHMWIYELQLFETPIATDPPTITTTAATSVDETSAVIHGSLDDDGGVPSEIRFQYGTTLSYELGSTPWVPDFVTGNTAGIPLTGLSNGTTYHFRAQARNPQGTTDGADATFTCAPVVPGWVSPNSDSDATGRWLDIPKAYDDEVSSFARCLHPSGDPTGTWSPYLYLYHPSMSVDAVRFLAKDDTNIDRAQIEVSPDGTSWTTVYNAAFANQTWKTVTFSPQHVDRARVRFRVANNGTGLYFELHEFDFNFTERPVLDPIAPQSVAEADTLNFGVSASDFYGDPLFLSAVDLPANASFADSGDGTGSLTFMPDYTQAGVHNVTIIASDGALADSAVVAITVTNVNLPPALDPIGPQSVAEGDTLSLGVSATDADGDSLAFTALDLPTNATFADSGDGTGGLLFLPDFTQAGLYDVTFIVSDGLLADSSVVTITVTEVDLPPVLDPIGPQSVAEGDTLTFGVSATDADGDSLILSALDLPANATFADSGDGTGGLSFLPDFTQAGLYNVTFIATAGALADSELVAITVVDVNRDPVLDPIGPQSVAEGDTLAFGVSATDADGDTLFLSALDLPANASFADSGDGTGSLSFLPDFTQGGSYDITFVASDGALADSAVVTVTVTGVNRPPVLADIPPDSVEEGATLTIHVSATDPDGDDVDLSAEALPDNATFADDDDGTGRLRFLPDFTQAGVYHIDVIATDGALADTTTAVITVPELNLTPVLADIDPQSVAEGDSLTLVVNASDADGDDLELSARDLPENSTFTDHGDRTGTLRFGPDFTQAGVYSVVFRASDGVLADSAAVAITVTEQNQAPVWAAVDPQSVAEGDTLTVPVTATDGDGDELFLSVDDLPDNVTFADNGDGTGSLLFLPDFGQAGVYDVPLYASDGELTDTLTVSITVTEFGRAPILADIDSQSVAEGDSLSIDVIASDPDGDDLFLSAENLPENASFVDNGDGTGSLVFGPDFTQAGFYEVLLVATDGAQSDSLTVAITVTDVNQAPILDGLDPQTLEEGGTLELEVNAIDPDGDELLLSADDLPENAAFTDRGDGTGSLRFDPDLSQTGLYEILLMASDGWLADSARVAITVTNLDQPPIWDEIGPRSVAEGGSLAFGVRATDVDGDSLTLSVLDLPANASFADSGNGTGGLLFDPDFTQAGVYEVTFVAMSGAQADSEYVAITVTEVNRIPELAAVGPQSVAEGDTLTMAISATDPDEDLLTLRAEDLPPHSNFTDNGDGTGSLRFHPDFTQAGVYAVTFIVTDEAGVATAAGTAGGTAASAVNGVSDGRADLAAADSALVVITVHDVNRAPVLAAEGPWSVAEGDTLTVGVSATDADGDSLFLSADDVPRNGTFTDHGNGTGSLIFLPDFTQEGAYEVTFGASDGALVDTEMTSILVTGVEQSPVLDPIGPRSVAEGDTLAFEIRATDVDGDSLILSAENLPPNAWFTDEGGGLGGFRFLPDYGQTGVYDVTFIAWSAALADSETVSITVDNVNRPPLLAPIGPQEVAESDSLTLGISARDADGDSLVLTAVGLPENASFVDHEDGTGTFRFLPDLTQSGAYAVTFIASDLSVGDSEVVTFTVTDLDSLVISGNAGIGGAFLTATGDVTLTTEADSTGAFSLRVPLHWSGAITPSRTGYEFTPPTRNYVAIATHQIGQDFAAVFVGGGPGGIIPAKFSLSQNYPNPVRPSTTIEYGIPSRSHVVIRIYNPLGRVVNTLVDEEKPPGIYLQEWDGTDNDGRPVGSGAYLYHISAGTFSQSRKMILLK